MEQDFPRAPASPFHGAAQELPITCNDIDVSKAHCQPTTAQLCLILLKTGLEFSGEWFIHQPRQIHSGRSAAAEARAGRALGTLRAAGAGDTTPARHRAPRGHRGDPDPRLPGGTG